MEEDPYQLEPVLEREQGGKHSDVVEVVKDNRGVRGGGAC